MSVTKNYNRSLKTRNDLAPSLNPLVFLSNPVDRPVAGYTSMIPAPWLPVEWQSEISKDWFVISSGKVVAWTRDGFIVPAGFKLRWAASTGVTYTANDYANKTMDITTGAEYATNGTTTYSVANITTALRARGLILASEDCDDFISQPVGAILYDVFAFAGGPNGWNPAFYKFQNYTKQQGVQFTSASQIILPIVPALHASVSVPGALTGATLSVGSGNIYNATNTLAANRYSEATNTDIVAWAIADYPIATDTDRTPVTGSSTDFLVREIKVDFAAAATSEEALGAAIDRLTTAGDFFIDYEAGVIFIYAAGGTAIPSNATGESITFYSYAAAPASVERYTCIVGNPHPGDWLKVDSNSNFQVWTTSDADTDRIARVHRIEFEPKDLLDRVQTAWKGSEFGAKQQMTGSASKGYSSTVTYSNAADKVARIVLNIR